jgi:hypothetical protein
VRLQTDPFDSPNAPPRVDWRLVATWTAGLVGGELAEIRAVFADQGARGPTLIRRPTRDQIPVPELRALFDHWVALSAGRHCPHAREIDPLDMKAALGYVHLLDVLDDGVDFRYRLFGSKASSVSGFDLTGRLVSEGRAPAYIGQFALAVYRVAFESREPVLTTHGPAGAIHTAAWHRLVLPLADETGAITRLLSGNVPVGHDGRAVRTRW